MTDLIFSFKKKQHTKKTLLSSLSGSRLFKIRTQKLITLDFCGLAKTRQ